MKSYWDTPITRAEAKHVLHVFAAVALFCALVAGSVYGAFSLYASGYREGAQRAQKAQNP